MIGLKTHTQVERPILTYLRVGFEPYHAAALRRLRRRTICDSYYFVTFVISRPTNCLERRKRNRQEDRCELCEFCVDCREDYCTKSAM